MKWVGAPNEKILENLKVLAETEQRLSSVSADWRSE